MELFKLEERSMAEEGGGYLRLTRWRAKPLVTSYETPYDDGGCRRAAVLAWLNILLLLQY